MVRLSLLFLFALNDWRNAEFDKAGILIEGNLGIYMGNITFTDGAGKKTTVDKLFVFRFDDKGNPVIIVHKSALPFQPQD